MSGTGYKNPVPTVDAIIEIGDERKIVLIERKNEPHGWALPGGFVDYGETVAAAAVREALEETGLRVALIELFHVYSDPTRDARLHTVFNGLPGPRRRRAQGRRRRRPRRTVRPGRAAVAARLRPRHDPGRLPPLPRQRRAAPRGALMTYRFILADDEKRELLRIARATLREFLRSGRIPPGKPHRESMLAEAGAFVTLHDKDGELRGCIGNIGEDKPLYKAIQEMAVAAASRDPRFTPLAPEELDAIEIEISVLGAAEPVHAPADITIGEHGLLIEDGGHRGLLLPQVATEHDLDATGFLEAVCRKAQLPSDAWQSPAATVKRFTAQVFSDQTHPRKH